jgi:hypothetical protein
MQVRTTHHVDASEPGADGLCDSYYEYDITVFAAEDLSLVARSYTNASHEAHFLRAESGSEHRQLTDKDMKSPLVVEATAYLRAQGKSEINWLSGRGIGYELVPNGGFV